MLAHGYVLLWRTWSRLCGDGVHPGPLPSAHRSVPERDAEPHTALAEVVPVGGARVGAAL